MSIVLSCDTPSLKFCALTVTSFFTQTFTDIDADKDGKINKEEWKAFAVGNPTVLLKNMTLAYLKYLTLSIHFIVNFVTIIIIQLLRVYCDCKTSAFLVQKKLLVREFYFGLEHNLGRCH